MFWFLKIKFLQVVITLITCLNCRFQGKHVCACIHNLIFKMVVIKCKLLILVSWVLITVNYCGS